MHLMSKVRSGNLFTCVCYHGLASRAKISKVVHIDCRVEKARKTARKAGPRANGVCRGGLKQGLRGWKQLGPSSSDACP